VIAYAESSAVLAWLLGEAQGDAVREHLARAERVVSSTLTAVECGRAIVRGVRDGAIGRTDELAALRLLDSAVASWVTLEMTGLVIARARRAFPREPVRTLDAIHLATAVQFQEALPDLAVVSLDQRVRQNAQALAMTVVP
jgi:predicted nucleic acid-binding protein